MKDPWPLSNDRNSWGHRIEEIEGEEMRYSYPISPGLSYFVFYKGYLMATNAPFKALSTVGNILQKNLV